MVWGLLPQESSRAGLSKGINSLSSSFHKTPQNWGDLGHRGTMTFPGPPRLHMCHRCTSCVGSACASRVSAWEGRYQDGRQTESLWGPQTIALGVLSCNMSGEAQRVPPAVSVSERGQESPGLQWWVFCPVSVLGLEFILVTEV